MIHRRVHGTRHARALLVAVALVASTGHASFADVVPITPGHTAGWAYQHGSCGPNPSTGTARTVTGPATPPLGAGSVEFTIGSDGDSLEAVRASGFHGTPLSDLNALTYSTYVQGTATGQAPYLILDVDLDGDDAADDQLLFEPVYQTGAYAGDAVPDQGELQADEWQTWDARAGGWWAVSAATFGPPLVTLDTYVASNPAARIVNSLAGGGVRIATGCGAGSWDGFTGAADALILTVAGAPSTFDLEPAAAPSVAIDAGSFVNAEEVSAVTLSGTYDATGSVSAITAGISADAGCDTSGPGTTPSDAVLDATTGTWTAGPFDLSDGATFADGSTVCAYAFATLSSGEVGLVGTAPATIDLTPPAVGTVAFDDADGFLNAAEILDGVDLTLTAADDADAVGARVQLEGSDGAPAECGPTDTSASGTTAIDPACAAALPDGPVTASASWLDAADNVSSAATASAVKDTVASVAITFPTAGARVATVVELSGTAEPGSTVVVSEGPVTLAETTDDEGRWHVAVERAQGPHTLAVSATDAAGNVASTSVAVVVDRQVPIIDSPAEGALVPSVTRVTGRAARPGVIELYENGEFVIRTRTDANGVWGMDVGFTAGTHTFTARWVDDVGTPSVASAPRTIVSDNARPQAAVTTADRTPFLPGSPTAIEGTASDDRGIARVELRYFTALGAMIATHDAACPACGSPTSAVTWSDAPSFGPGVYEVQVRAYDLAGQVSTPAYIQFVRL